MSLTGPDVNTVILNSDDERILPTFVEQAGWHHDKHDDRRDIIRIRTQKNKLNGSIYPMTSYSEEQMMPANQGTSL